MRSFVSSRQEIVHLRAVVAKSASKNIPPALVVVVEAVVVGIIGLMMVGIGLVIVVILVGFVAVPVLRGEGGAEGGREGVGGTGIE